MFQLMRFMEILAPGKTSVETDAYKPSSPYAASKASADHLIRSYYRTFKLPVIITIVVTIMDQDNFLKN